MTNEMYLISLSATAHMINVLQVLRIVHRHHSMRGLQYPERSYCSDCVLYG